MIYFAIAVNIISISAFIFISTLNIMGIIRNLFEPVNIISDTALYLSGLC